ncbi:phosphatase PAP2 family protein [Croceiramulus getboli]|nr:phosphatase PAP2 family protein [Flavobacteriaceae bacterium YJPT1-3]
MWRELQRIDSELFVYLNNLPLGDYTAFWVFVTQIEHWIPLYLLFAVLFAKAYSARAAVLGIVFTLFTFATTLALTNWTKVTVARLRPNNTPELEELIRVLQTPDNFSFFSGHAANSFAVSVFVVLALRNSFSWIYFVFLWPLLFSSSRIFVGVHFPGDILVGAGVGTLLGLLFYQIFKKIVLKFRYN